MSEPEAAKIMCSPASWDIETIANSEKRMAACGHEVWVAPSSLAMLENEENITLHCIPCAITSDDFAESLAEHGVSLRPGQREELNEALGIGVTDQFVAALENARKPKSL